MHSFRALFAVTLLAIGTAHAASILNTFDSGQTPPPGGPGPNAPTWVGPNGVDANGVHALGVNFGFMEGGNPSTAAMYGVTLGTSADQIDPPLHDPVLNGAADGVLSLVFDFPSTFIDFFIAYPTPSDSVVHVTIGGNTTDVTTTGGQGMFGLFSVGHVSLTPASAFSSASITFDSTAGSFSIDNLQYDANAATSAPEPASIAFFGAGVLLLGALVVRRSGVR